MHFYFLAEVLLELIIFLLGFAAAAACAAYNISTEAERGTGYCFFLLRFCPLECDASVIGVDCAAVETGCIPGEYIPAKGCNKIRAHFYFWVEVLLLLLLRAAAAVAHNISTEAERGTGYCFLLLRLRYYYCCPQHQY